MRILLLIAFTALALSGCGKPYKGKQDAAFNPFVAYFTAFTGLDASFVDMKFIEYIDDGPGMSTVGYCEIDGGKATVVIKTSFWNVASNALKRNLIMHELGHCVQGLMHNDDVIDGCPTTYMSSILIGAYCWDQVYGKDVFSE